MSFKRASLQDGMYYVKVTPESKETIGLIRGGSLETIFGAKYNLKNFPDFQVGERIPNEAECSRINEVSMWIESLKSLALKNPESPVAIVLSAHPPPRSLAGEE